MRELVRGKKHSKKRRAGFVSTAVFTSFTLLTSCYPAILPKYQKERVSSLDEAALVIREQTTEYSFIKMLKNNGATNIVSSKGFIKGKMISAVTADFMEYVYIFRGKKYLTRFKVQCDAGNLPLHPFVKVVYGKNGFGVLLIAENVRHKGRRVMQLLMKGNGGNATSIMVPVDDLIRRHKGMLDPYVMGQEIIGGITMCARDYKGNPWKVVYIIRKTENGIKMEKKDRRKAEECTCFLEWLGGKGGRETGGMKVE